MNQDPTPWTIAVERKQFGTAAPVLQGLQLTLAHGEVVALVGPSGAGKSTLLRILSGLDTDYVGHVPPAPGGGLGMAFQDARLMPWLDVAANLRLVAPALNDAALNALLDSVGLAGCAGQFPGQLSGGMQRRVALLRAFVRSPRWLLLDEPFQALDAPTAAQLRQLLLDLWQQTRPGVLLVTHHLSEALALADRVLFLGMQPAQVVLDHRVTTPRVGDLDCPAVRAQQQALMQAHPQLLHGLVGPARADR